MDLARFERATSTFAESRSNSTELQVLQLRIAECGLRNGGSGQIILTIRILKSAIRNRLAEAAGVEPASALRDGLANRCHTVRRRLLGLAEGTGFEPASAMRGSFQDYCLTS